MSTNLALGLQMQCLGHPQPKRQQNRWSLNQQLIDWCGTINVRFKMEIDMTSLVE